MSDEVTNFLRSVEALKERREEEDEARSRELEEKILQEKRERQARRAERARSISPQKSSPANTPPPQSLISLQSSLSSLHGFLPTSSPTRDTSESPQTPKPSESFHSMDASLDLSGSTSPTKENELPFDNDIKRPSLTSPSGATPPSQSPLSWQRRPLSQASDRPKSRPLSMFAAENAAARSSNLCESTSLAEKQFFREQMAHSLAGKDTSWFRQTSDRGQTSAVSCRGQVEQDAILMSVRAQPPGMARDEPEQRPQSAGSQPSSPAVLGSPFALRSPERLEPPSTDGSNDRVAQSGDIVVDGRGSPTRSQSPTKGIGGFVQSAMMKRTDSVKRWSVTSPTGLQRADSVISNRTRFEPLQRRSIERPFSRLNSTFKEGLFTSSSRPLSDQEKEADSRLQTSEQAAVTDVSASVEKISPPASPSKTMNPRRWSPIKSSSWLEAALNKPEPSIKAKPTASATTQPPWMVELNKAKAQRANSVSGNVDLDRTAPNARKHEVKTGGLMRSTAMGAAAKPAGLAGIPKVTAAENVAIGNLRANLYKTPPRASSELPEGASEDLAKIWDSAAENADESKTKPETPTQKDFHLKPRASPRGSSSSQAQDELKSVFGNLRRTKTQNFKAPDEFKTNILRGKAALNLTGGPKKSERVDELKEGILKKKEEFKRAQQEGRGVPFNASTSYANDKPVPEGLVRKLELGRSNGTLKRNSVPAVSDMTRSRSSETRASNPFSPIEARTWSVLPPKNTSRYEDATTTASLRTQISECDGRMPGKVGGGGGLADRFNPALAGLLARGPPGTSASCTPGASVVAQTKEPGSPGPLLTHMTKNRARGPKRKVPTLVAKASERPAQMEAFDKPEPEPEPEMSERSSPVEEEKLVQSINPPKLKSRPSFAKEKTSSSNFMIPLVDFSARQTEDAIKGPGESAKPKESASPRTRSRSPTKVHEQVAALAAKSQQESKPVDMRDEISSQPSSPKKLDLKRMSRFFDEKAETNVQSEPEPEKVRDPSPVKFLVRPLPLPDPISIAAPSSPKRKPVAQTQAEARPPVTSPGIGKGNFGGVGLGLSQQSADRITSTAEASSPIDLDLPRPPPKDARPLLLPPQLCRDHPQKSTSMRSPTKYGLEVSTMLSEFFGPERPKRNYNADAAEILMKRSLNLSPRIQPQKTQLFAVTRDSKKVSVPAHLERVLFDCEMYLCTHTYLNEAGKKVNEIYFWTGDQVPESVVEDALVFVQKDAKSYGGKYIRLSQAKETPEFIQALGGIVIVRRGSSNKYDSLAPSMLCGRRYLGQVAFDEVDFSPASLCSGFPYLITQSGKCYLWKGKGADIEELGCARLVGMELALMGELAEVDDGDEPATFWDVFGGMAAPPRPHSADHWRLKPNYDRYCGRLFRSTPEDRQQIVEISPFSQADLLPSAIYVLDAFFEMYIMVGSCAQHQYAAFHNALDFTQEYAILAAGVEDRPFVPISTVVLEGVPRDLKSVFRKWEDGRAPTVSLNINNPASSNIKRGRSLRIVPLSQALQALTE